ncbi:MAG TPA: TetR/AcrR family transcriptional regulator [Thermodesulfovibrionales bacterium]|nr:TetR/AcrR family transcriptional regulator [Thermodesulfovibrionales bacterium]
MGIADRKEREKERLRDLILTAAMKLFLKEGYERITLRRIAEEIEYSPATIYLHFRDKDEILYALHEKGFEEFYKRQQTVLSIKDPLRRLKRHGQVYVEFALENPEYYDLMFIMRGPAKKIRQREEWHIGRRSYEFLRENVKDCMEAGRLPGGDLDVATFSLWSHVHGIASLIIRERCAMFPEEKMPLIVQGALAFFLGPLLQEER